SSFYAFSWGNKLLDTKYAPAEASFAEGKSQGMRARASDKLLIALEIARDELFYLLRFLIAGAAAAASIRLFMTQKQILDMSGGMAASILALMLLGTVLCLNSNIDSSYMAALSGAYTGEAMLGFLVAGSMMDLKSVSMLLSVFKARAVAVLAITVYLLTFILCVVSKYIFF
ncbi:MAG: permease, partial [Actinobacteria bacterium]|nr:permease [Actinomycetota bacterium]